MPGFDHGVLSIVPVGTEATDECREPGGFAPSVLPDSTTLSARLWGLDLNRGLPRTLTSDGVQAAPGDRTRVRDFLATEFPVFREEELGATPSERILDAKRWYLHNACDVLELRHDERTVGVLIGAPEDWSSYYVRIFAILQAYQRPALRRRFIRECLFEPLIAHQVERIVADTSPMNLGMAVVFNELHFHVTGHQLSDRWGPLVRYTKFIDPACEAAFNRRFAGIAGGSTSPRKEDPP
ncbi:MAG TPA: hypothetical protein VJV78_32545 [Polyangiales bacterium]|nr:hypothetical protein [Polyangiales bacterium]